MNQHDPVDIDPPPLAGRAPRVPDGVRIYAVGDVHGHLDLLLRLEAMIDADARAAGASRVVQVMLGDYIDRGPDSRGVVEHLIARRQERELVTLRGNHEAYVLDLAHDPLVLLGWARYGGRETLASYGYGLPDLDEPALLDLAPRIAAQVFEALPETHLAFFRETVLHHACGDYLFVHAGLRPGVPLARQKPGEMMMIRQGFLNSDTDFGRVVVHGHTPGPEPVIRANRIGIDTHAYHTGVLTCLVLEGEEQRFLST